MGIHGGPRVAGVNDLQLYYDLRNPESYLGEPTTNLNTDPYHSTRTEGQTISLASWGGDTGYGRFDIDDSPTAPGNTLCFVNVNTSNPAGTGGTYTDFPSTRFTLEEGKTYTRSWWMKSDINQSISAHICSCNRDSNNAYIVAGSYSVTTEWQRFSHTFSVSSANAASDWQFRHINYNSSSIWIARVQLEEKGHATPFVNGTRSATNGLRDLSGNDYHSDLDEITFNSDAEIEWDGVDDTVIVSNNSSILKESETTLSIWFKASDTTASQRLLRCVGSNTNRYYIILTPNSSISVVRGNNTSRVVSMSLGTTWHNITTWWNSSGYQLKIWIDGVLKYNGTYSGVVGGGNEYLRLGTTTGTEANFNGKMDMIQVWHRELSNNEVQKNYYRQRRRFK